MNKNITMIGTDLPHLHILEDSEEPVIDKLQIDLEEQRKQTLEQIKAEEFWAGRNLAGRNSTRWAA